MKKLVVIFGICAVTMSVTAQTIRYVTPNGAGSKSGASWVNASNDLQLMIDQSNSGDEVWVRTGTYTPAYDATGCDYSTNKRPTDNSSGNSKDNAFVLKPNVKVYGDFAGTENSLAERVPTTENLQKFFPYILSSLA